MSSIAAIDYWIIAIYFVLTLGIGLIMTRKASSSLDHYFLAGREMPWYLLGIAGMTAWFDMTGTMIITSFLFMLGPRGLFIEFRGGAVLVLIFMIAYTGKWHRRSGCMTGAEWMAYRFGKDRAAEWVRILMAAFGIVAWIGALAYLVRGTSLFMGMFFPQYTPKVLTFWIIAATTLYTMCAGFYGVVLTDLIQGIIIMVSCVMIALIGWRLVPDAASLGATAQAVTGNAQWLSSVPTWYTKMPRGYGDYEFLIVIASFYFVRNMLAGLGTGAEQRYFGARSDRDCGLQSALQGVTVALRWPMMMGFAVMGIYLISRMFPSMSAVGQATQLIKTHYPSIAENEWHDKTSWIVNNLATQPAGLVEGLKALLGPGDWTTKMPLVGFHGTVNPEMVLPAVLMWETPAGLKGFIIVAMFAAMMSTFTSTVNGASSLWVKDIYQNFMRPQARNRELIAMSWVSSLVIVAIGFYLGLGAKSINTIWGWIIMGLGAGGLAPSLLRLYWWRMNAWGMIGGIVAGMVGAIYILVANSGPVQKIVEWQQFLLTCGLSFAGSIIGAYIGPHTAMDRLRHVYRTMRPFGWWEPVKATFTPEEQRELTREHKSDILTLPFALVCQVTIFLMPMQLVIKSYKAFWWTMPLFLIGLAGMYWYWWRNLPPRDETPVAPPEIEPEPEREAVGGRVI